MSSIIRKSSLSANRSRLHTDVYSGEMTAIISSDITGRACKLIQTAQAISKSHSVAIIDTDNTTQRFSALHHLSDKQLKSRMTRFEIYAPDGRISVKVFSDEVIRLVEELRVDVLVIYNYDTLQRLAGPKIAFTLLEILKTRGIAVIIACSPHRLKKGQQATADNLPASIAPFISHIIFDEPADSAPTADNAPPSDRQRPQPIQSPGYLRQYPFTSFETSPRAAMSKYTMPPGT